MFSTPLTCPTMLPNSRRDVPNMPKAQRGLLAILIKLAMVNLGGADKPFFKSL